MTLPDTVSRRYVCRECGHDLATGSLRKGHPEHDNDESVIDQRTVGWCWSCSDFVQASIPEPGAPVLQLPPADDAPPDPRYRGLICVECGYPFESGSVDMSVPDDLAVSDRLAVQGACWHCRAWREGEMQNPSSAG